MAALHSRKCGSENQGHTEVKGWVSGARRVLGSQHSPKVKVASPFADEETEFHSVKQLSGILTASVWRRWDWTPDRLLASGSHTRPMGQSFPSKHPGGAQTQLQYLCWILERTGNYLEVFLWSLMGHFYYLFLILYNCSQRISIGEDIKYWRCIKFSNKILSTLRGEAWPRLHVFILLRVWNDYAPIPDQYHLMVAVFKFSISIMPKEPCYTRRY